MNDDLLLTQLRGIDAYGTGVPLPEAWSKDDVLLEIERRATMDTTTEARTRRAAPAAHPRWRGPLIAATAFVTLVTAVGAAVWLNAGGADRPVAEGGTDPITAVHAFAAAVSAGETDLSGLLGPGASYTRVGTWQIDADLAEYWRTLDTRITLVGCELTARIVTCEGTHRNAIYDAMNRELTETWTFVMADGVIQQVLEDWGSSALGEDGAFPVQDYLAWLYVHRPEWVEGVDYVHPETGHTSFGRLETLPEAFLVLNRHNAEILMSHLDAYRADLEATGGLPDDWSADRWGDVEGP